MSSYKKTFLKKLWTVCLLAALMLAGPVLATDPEEVDPDPDFRSTILVVTDLTQVSPQELAPGRYLIRVITADGSETIHELVVAP
jgi:hypothetical protein